MKKFISIAIFAIISAVIIVSYVSAKDTENKAMAVNPNTATEITQN